MSDPVNHPAHYTSEGIECIQVTEGMNFNVGNAIKYLWRAGRKSSDPTEDLRKAAWYVAREIDRVRRERDGLRYTAVLAASRHSSDTPLRAPAADAESLRVLVDAIKTLRRCNEPSSKPMPERAQRIHGHETYWCGLVEGHDGPHKWPHDGSIITWTGGAA